MAPRIFEYEDGDGNDTIYYFNTNKALKANLNLDAQSLFLPTLHIKKGLIKEISLDGNDVIVKVGEGSVRLIDGVGKKFKLREADGYTTTRAYDRDSNDEIVCTIFGSSKNDALKDNVGFKKQSYIVAPDAPTPKDKIIGTVNKNVIYGNGGKGNDSLWGDTGADTFYYAKGDGNDVIYGFDSKDTLTLDNITFKTSMASYNKSKDVLTLNLSGGSITLKDFTTSTFHINNATYKISGSTLKKQ